MRYALTLCLLFACVPAAIAQQGEVKPEELPLLIEGLHNPVQKVRKQAAERLNLAGELAARPLCDELRLGRITRAITAGVVLRNLGTRGAVVAPELREILAAPQTEPWRWSVAAQVLRLVSPQGLAVALPQIRAGLRGHALQQHTACFVLPDVGETASEAIPDLLWLLDSSHAPLHAVSLEDSVIETQSIAFTQAVPQYDDLFVIHTLVRLKAQASDLAPRLRRLLRHDHPSVRTLAAQLMGQLGDPYTVEAAATLAGVAMDPRPAVRVPAIELMGELGAAAAAQSKLLVALIQDSNSEVRRASATTLKQIGPAARDILPELDQVISLYSTLSLSDALLLREVREAIAGM